MYFVSNRDVVIFSIYGHSIKFEKGKPTYVPRVMHEEVMEKGIIPVEEDGSPVDPVTATIVEDAPKLLLAPEDAFEREEKILGAIEKMVERNNPKEFTGGGRPATASVTQYLGWKAESTEINKVWEKHRARLLNK